MLSRNQRSRTTPYNKNAMRYFELQAFLNSKAVVTKAVLTTTIPNKMIANSISFFPCVSPVKGEIEIRAS
jgi:hypothetical protein